MDVSRKNVLVLAACQSLLLTVNVTLTAINGLAGFALAPVKTLATLPVTGYVVGAAMSTYFASLWMRRVGRRTGFMTGAAFGLAGAAICTLAMYLQSFWLLCFGTVVAGVHNAFGQYYRFAAADTAGVEFKSRAISLVLAGGIVGGIVGPETSKLTRELLAVPFMGSYAALMLFTVASMLLLRHVDIPAPTAAEREEHGRPLSRIAAQPVFLVAICGATVGYGVMNLLMTATPIAMSHHHHPYNDAAFVIEWHVIGMFAPSFFTGSLIRRFGVLPVMLAGALLMFACAGFALAGTGLYNFWSALVLLGVGWNFLYIGGTTLLTESYSPAEKARTQGLNDLAIFVTMATSSLASGALVTSAGWNRLNLWSLPFLTAATLAIGWLMLQRKLKRQPA